MGKYLMFHLKIFVIWNRKGWREKKTGGRDYRWLKMLLCMYIVRDV